MPTTTTLEALFDKYDATSIPVELINKHNTSSVTCAVKKANIGRDGYKQGNDTHTKL